MDVFIPNHTRIKSVVIPPSKSYAQRAIMGATLCRETTLLKSVGESADVQHLIHIAEQLGASVKQTGDELEITGFNAPVKSQLNVGESGLGVRLVTSIASVLHGNFKITGKGSLLRRPMSEFEAFLPQLGVTCITSDGFLPLELTGNAKGGTVELDGSLSSQYLSGLLMALPIAPQHSIINVHHLKSKPYIDITLDVLRSFNINIEHSNYSTFKMEGNQRYQSPGIYTVEGDYSGASNWMVYGAINGTICIEGLNPNTVQGDSAMLDALKKAGVNYHWTAQTLTVEKSTIHPFEFDANECPDLFPALVVLATAAKGKTVLKGVGRLTHKESNRATVLQKEFGRLGLKIELEGDEMHILGGGELKTGEIHSHNDHRIAMAGAIAAGLTRKGISILEAESVGKSYPDFWENFALEPSKTSQL